MTTETQRWLARQAAREARIVVLEEALLGGRLVRYAWYRLRWFFATYLVESAGHAVLAVTLFAALGSGNAVLVVGAHAGTLLLSHLWWGVLEALRAQVRDLHRAARPHRIPAVIAGWLTASLLLAGTLAVAVGGWLVAVLAAGRFGVTEALVATVALRLVLDIPTRAFHSGVYAMRRVYKPLAATMAPQVTGLVLTLALVPAIGAWGLVVSTLATTGLVTGLTLRYTGRVYRFLGIRTRPEIGWPALRVALRGTGREAAAAGAAHAVTGLDALVVLALLSGATTDSASLFVLFLTMPTIAAGAEWARLLYFDLKRLELRLFTNLRHRFELATEWLAVALGLGFGVVASTLSAAASGWADAGPADAGVPIALTAFFVARSALACAQVQAFAERSYAMVVGTGALGIAGFVAAAALTRGETARLAALAVVAALCALAVGRLNSTRARATRPVALLTLEWLQRLGEVRGPVRVGMARLATAPGPDRLDARSREEADRWRLAQLADRTAHRLGGTGAAAWIGPDRVVWLADPAGPQRVTAGWLQRASGGLVHRVQTVQSPDGAEALLQTARSGLLGRPAGALLTTLLPVDAAAARDRFTRLVPDGLVYAPGEPAPAALAALPGPELRAILADATAFARDLGVRRRRSRFDVTPLCAGGQLELIFVADRAAGRRARGDWQREVRTLNLRAAIAGLRPQQAVSGG